MSRGQVIVFYLLTAPTVPRGPCQVNTYINTRAPNLHTPLKKKPSCPPLLRGVTCVLVTGKSQAELAKTPKQLSKCNRGGAAGSGGQRGVAHRESFPWFGRVRRSGKNARVQGWKEDLQEHCTSESDT